MTIIKPSAYDPLEGEMNFAFESGDESPHSISEAVPLY